MKKLTLSLAAAGLVASSLGAYAAVPTGAAPFQVMVPNVKSGFDFLLEGLYVQPTAHNLNYLETSPQDNDVFKLTSFNPHYDFGFTVGAGYTFPNSGNALRLDWTHFSHGTNDSTLVSSGNEVARPQIKVPALAGDEVVVQPLKAPLSSSQAVNASSSVSFKYDAVDLDMSQYMSIGTRLQTRLFAGLRYANLKQDVTDHYSFVDTAPSAALDGAPVLNSGEGTFVENYKFAGVGPRVGIDTSYHLGDCFGVTAHFATALLVGRSEANAHDSSSYVQTTSGLETDTTTTVYNPIGGVTTDKQTRIVPAFDAKLGLDYTFGFNNDNSNVVIEAGYKVTQYVDVVRNSNSTTGIGFNGPYLSLDVKV